MWRMEEGDRVLTEAEWALFAAGLDLLLDFIEEDISAATDDTETGVVVFDRLTPEQNLALLADVASALRDPSVPTPPHTAVNEGAIMAVFFTLRMELEAELDAAGGDEAPATAIRRLLLAACADSDDREEPLPDLNSLGLAPWNWLVEEIEGRIFWDYDFAMGDEFLDLPPKEARAKLVEFGIDPDYYLAVPDEPDERGLTVARQTLARLLGPGRT
jgi:hypothetical protein